MTMETYRGGRIRETGRKEAGEDLTLPEGLFGLYLLDGEAQWFGNGTDTALLGADDTPHRLIGPGRLLWRTPGRYVLLAEGDALGFGGRAFAYRTLIETHNRDVGRALARGIDLQAGQTWVDLGTGTGAMIQALAESGRPDIWVLGIDRADPMLEEAWRHSDIPFPTWYVGRDLLALPWPKERFDGITALLVLHLVDDLGSLSARCLQALKPGGVLAYAVSSDANPFLHLVMKQLDGPGRFFKQGAAKIHRVIRETGFEILDRKTYREEIRVTGPDVMRHLIGSIGGPGSVGLREDVSMPAAVTREFELVWARKRA